MQRNQKDTATGESKEINSSRNGQSLLVDQLKQSRTQIFHTKILQLVFLSQSQVEDYLNLLLLEALVKHRDQESTSHQLKITMLCLQKEKLRKSNQQKRKHQLQTMFKMKLIQLLKKKRRLQLLMMKKRPNVMERLKEVSLGEEEEVVAEEVREVIIEVEIVAVKEVTIEAAEDEVKEEVEVITEVEEEEATTTFSRKVRMQKALL